MRYNVGDYVSYIYLEILAFQFFQGLLFLLVALEGLPGWQWADLQLLRREGPCPPSHPWVLVDHLFLADHFFRLSQEDPLDPASLSLLLVPVTLEDRRPLQLQEVPLDQILRLDLALQAHLSTQGHRPLGD